MTKQSEQQRILVIAPSWVGDTIMAQSLFKQLHHTYCQPIIDVVAPLWSYQVLQRMPEVRQVLTLEVPHGKLGLRTRFKLASFLKKQAYQKAFVLPNSWKSALIPWLACIPERIGWLGECRWGLLTQAKKLDCRQYPRMVERYVALAGDFTSAPLPALTVDPQHRETLCKRHQVDTLRPILALCPGAAYGPAKQWPVEYYLQIVAKKLADNWQIWCFGSQADHAVAQKIADRFPGRIVNFSGKLSSILETIDLMSLVTQVVSNDSGLMHLAAALKKPVVAIYGSTSPAFTPPLGEQHTILYEQQACSPCFKRTCSLGHYKCLWAVTPKQVLLALEQQP